jgi:hypothetical protein
MTINSLFHLLPKKKPQKSILPPSPQRKKKEKSGHVFYVIGYQDFFM